MSGNSRRSVGPLGRGLLHTILAEAAMAGREQRPHRGGRKRLGHDNQADGAGRPFRLGLGCGNAAQYRMIVGQNVAHETLPLPFAGVDAFVEPC